VSDEIAEFVTEKAFKESLRRQLSEAGIWCRPEFYVGNLMGAGWSKTGVSGFVDIASPKQKWFAECKLSASTAALSRGLGQCLFYKHFLPEFRAFLAFPTEGNTLFDTGIMRKVCWSHGVVLTDNKGIEDEVSRWITGRQPFFVALNDYIKDREDKPTAIGEFYELDKAGAI
jgi:hypothetical protein